MELQKKEPQNLELMPPQISEAEKFSLARSAKKIKDSDDNEVRQALRYAMVKIGLRGQNFPKDIEKILLVQHVYLNYGENTPEEIKIAFDWAIMGRLEVDTNCYENFSCAYFSKIMNAYNALAGKVNNDDTKPVLLIENKVQEEFNIEEYRDFLKTEFTQKLRSIGVNLPEL